MDASSSGGEARKFTRLAYRKDTVHVKVRQPGGQEALIKVACRNLSSGGMSVLHNAYIHPGSWCAAALSHRSAGPTIVEGRVVRCQHRVGVVHEIGVKFDKPIHLADFVEADRTDTILSFESVNPDDLEGRILLVDRSEMDAALVRHFLKETRLRIAHATSLEQAEAMLNEELSALILDVHIDADDGAIFLDRLRADGNDIPVIATCVSLPASIRQMIGLLANVRVLMKPLEEKTLQRALAEFILQESGRTGMRVEQERVRTNLPREVVETFRKELHEVLQELERGSESGDAQRCRSASLRIAGSAPAVGLATLGQLAASAARRIGDGGIEAAEYDLDALRMACKRYLAA